MIAKGITKVQEQDADDIAFNYATSAGYNIGQVYIAMCA